MDENFNIKLADFGFAARVEGRDGKGFLKTYLGTPNYMAPEIHFGQPYQGRSIDLFASAMILFVALTQHMPFSEGSPRDKIYTLIAESKADRFWAFHSKQKPADFFSPELQDLITSMI